MSFLFLGDPSRCNAMRKIFLEEAEDIAFRCASDPGDHGVVRYIATWHPPTDLAAKYPSLELLFSTGAGIDQFDLETLPPAVSLIRLMEDNLKARMVEYVSGAVLALHRDFFAYRRAQRQRLWQERPVIAADRRRVSFLGAGELACASIAALVPFGFTLAAWSRLPKVIEGAMHFAGPADLPKMLMQTDILICLLPLTAETKGILNRDLFSQLPSGAALINVGRGQHLISDDLLAALDIGHMSQAILDVFDPEPVPGDHVFWHHPQVLMTPHIASVFDPVAAARTIIANIRRHREGRIPNGIVNRDQGY